MVLISVKIWRICWIFSYQASGVYWRVKPVCKPGNKFSGIKLLRGATLPSWRWPWCPGARRCRRSRGSPTGRAPNQVGRCKRGPLAPWCDQSLETCPKVFLKNNMSLKGSLTSPGSSGLRKTLCWAAIIWRRRGEDMSSNHHQLILFLWVLASHSSPCHSCLFRQFAHHHIVWPQLWKC